jgi:hypothetical protein
MYKWQSSATADQGEFTLTEAIDDVRSRRHIRCGSLALVHVTPFSHNNRTQRLPDIDPTGKSWESTLRGRRFHGLTYPHIAPRFTRTVTRRSFQK